MKIYLLVLFSFIFSFSATSQEAEKTKEEEEKIKECFAVSKEIRKQKYEIATPNEKTVVRKFYYEKIEKLIKNYVANENKDLVGLYYADILNNRKPLLLAKVRENLFCNYAYFVYFDANDNIRRLVKNNNRDYISDFDGNYKLFCKGENSEEIIKINGTNYLISKNYGGRINRIDRVILKSSELDIENICYF